MPKTYSSDLVRNTVWQSNLQRCCQWLSPNIEKSATALQEGQQELSLAIFVRLFLPLWASMCLHILKITCICMPLKLAPRKMRSGTSVCLHSHRSLAQNRSLLLPSCSSGAGTTQTVAPTTRSRCSHLTRLQLCSQWGWPLPCPIPAALAARGAWGTRPNTPGSPSCLSD